jgi:2-oxoglutarate dehydrogenase E2 component (dihydrolipoamide succinyltransferase)
MDHIRKSIAKHMVTSAHTSPHVTSVHEIDVTKIKEYITSVQEEFRKKEGAKLTLTSFIAQAVIKALKEFSIVNASIDGNDIVYHREVNLGIAVALENGLIVPVIRRADEYNLVGLTKAIFDIATRARSKKLSPDEVQGGTFSISNYGVFDTLIGTPIINQPQVAILGTGAAKQKPVVINGMIGIRWMMYLSLTYDHRLLDGAMGGKFLMKITELLENFKPGSID